MKIEIAVRQDLPELLALENRALSPLYDKLGLGCSCLGSSSPEQAYEEFDECVTLKVQNDKGRIVGSVQGDVAGGLLYIGRLMVLPEYQQHGIGRKLLHAIQNHIPHDRAWLYTCQEDDAICRFYQHEGFNTFDKLISKSGLTWLYMIKE